MIEKIKNLTDLEKRRLFALAGAFLMYVIVTVVFVYLVDKRIIRLPFHRVKSLPEAYMSMFKYLIYFIIFMSSMLWLVYAKMPIKEFFSRGKYTGVFYVGLAVSIAYAVYSLVFNTFTYHPIKFFPPIIILSILNAYAEEVFYRLGLYRLLKNFISNIHIANVIQAVLYSFVHIFIGGFELAAPGFFYGLIMGYVFEKGESITPSVICHFCIDIGVIGLPMMILKYT